MSKKRELGGDQFMVERRKIRKSGILDALIRYSDGTAISGKQVVVNYFSLLPAYRVGVPPSPGYRQRCAPSQNTKSPDLRATVAKA